MSNSEVFLINIDDYKFYALFKFLDPEGRNVIYLKSINKKTNDQIYFYVYNSVSEGGIFRLLYFHHYNSPSDFGYYKGRDYVTESFIHMYLQKAIYEKFERIPFNPEITLKNVNDDPHLQNTKYIFQIYNRRLLKTPDLEPLRLCPTGKCLTNKYLDYILGLKADSSIDKELEPIISKMDQDIYDRFLSEIREDNENFKKELNNQKEILAEIPLSQGELNSIFADMKTEYYVKKLNSYFSSLIDWSSISNFKNLFSNKIELLNGLFLINNYFSFDVSISGHNLEIIINNYFLKTKHNSKNNLIITNIIPKENSINDCGTYNKIVSAGILIYKIFEHQQMTNTRNNSLHPHYMYIAKYLANLDLLHFVNEEYKIQDKSTKE